MLCKTCKSLQKTKKFAKLAKVFGVAKAATVFRIEVREGAGCSIWVSGYCLPLI